MKTPKLALLAGVAAGLIFSGPVWAGAKLKIDDESMIDLGFRVQALTIFTDTDLDGDGSFDDETDFRVRRARFRLKGTVNQYVSAFIQTESGSESGGSGTDMRIIDSWVNLKYNNWVQGFFGQHMAPSSRQATTSSGGLMTIDRPNNNTKNLTWGARATNRFATATFSDSNDGAISGPNAVRDVGLTGNYGTHTLRKTFITQMARLGIGREIRDRLTNHVDPSVDARHYNAYDYLSEKRAALQLWDTELREICGSVSND